MGGMSVNDPQELLDMYRPPQEVEMWQKKDPIDRLQNKLLASNVLKEENCLEIYKLASKEVADASELAQLDPYPSDKYLKMGGVLSGNNDGENA
jgi:TPP-dependent pyruvate/acetoin dehydrogenase alpha subunit